MRTLTLIACVVACTSSLHAQNDRIRTMQAALAASPLDLARSYSAAKQLLDRNPNPSEREIRLGLEGNLCRCTGYHNIVKAIQAAAKVMAPGAEAKAPASVS